MHDDQEQSGTTKHGAAGTDAAEKQEGQADTRSSNCDPPTTA